MPFLPMEGDGLVFTKFTTTRSSHDVRFISSQVVSEALLSLGTVYCSWAAVDATMTPMEKNQSFFIVKMD